VTGKDSDSVGSGRVLVALDASSESLAVLDQAATLAALLEAELAAVFVEDEDLLRLSGLPFAREFSLLTGGARVLDLATMEHEMRLHAGQARQRLTAAANRRRLRWSFQVARGRMETELRAAARESDVLAVPKRRRFEVATTTLCRIGHGMAESLSCSVLLAAPDQAPDDGLVAVVWDGSNTTVAALKTAARLAAGGGGKLVVLMFAADGDEQKRLENEALTLLGGLSIKVAFRNLPSRRTFDLPTVVAEMGVGLLVMEADGERGVHQAKAVEDAGCAVLLVRAGR
jgi:hypothetical protein